jgi:WD40 repeat protein
MILSSNKIIKSKNEFPFTQIYYVNHIGTWLTIDQESGIHLWDLEKETSDELPMRHTGIILDMEEIIYLKIVVFSTLKQQLVFWNLAMRLLIKIINLDTVSIHSMCFVPDYKLLATANFGKNILLWRFVDQDITKCTELVGHTSQVTCVNYLLDSPLIITSDDTGLIKAWDLRNSQ